MVARGRYTSGFIMAAIINHYRTRKKYVEANKMHSIHTIHITLQIKIVDLKI
jgi:hypothetical protein